MSDQNKINATIFYTMMQLWDMIANLAYQVHVNVDEPIKMRDYEEVMKQLLRDAKKAKLMGDHFYKLSKESKV